MKTQEEWMRWWEKEPLVIMEVADCFDSWKVPISTLARFMKDHHANAQHFHCMLLTKSAGSSGADDGGFYFNSKLAAIKHSDRLKAYLPLAHRAGIRVIVYVNVHWYSKDFGSRHPDWLQKRHDGSPVDTVYSTGVSFCINSSYREWVFQLLKELCAYPIDGIFYDGPIFFSDSCYCDSCVHEFQKRTGKNPPQKSDKNHPLWKEFISFQIDSYERFLKESNEIIKSIRQDILFYINGNSHWPNWPTGRDNHRIIKHTDIFGAEGGFLYGDLNQKPVYKPGMTGKLLVSQARGKPAIVFDTGEHRSWNWFLLPEAEVSILLAETLSSGANYWYACFAPNINQPELDVVKRYNLLIKKNPDAFFQTKSLANVALVWPGRSAETYLSSVPFTDFTREIKDEEIGDVQQEFAGWYEVLARSQVPFDVIDEEGFDNLSQYQMIVLPNAACLSAEDTRALKEFVAEGGTLVSDFETSLYDEQGNKRDDFTLAEIIGAHFSGHKFGPMMWDYIIPQHGKHLLSGIIKRYLPATRYGIEVSTGTADVLFFFAERMAGCYDHLPEISREPFLLVNRYKKGTSIYFAGTFGASFGQWRFQDYLQIASNIFQKYTKQLISIKDSPNLEVNIRAKDGKIYLHLVNATSSIKRPIYFIMPLANVIIEIPGFAVTKARALRLKKNLQLQWHKKIPWIILPRIEEYEVIELSST